MDKDAYIAELVRKINALEKRLNRLEARGGFSITSTPWFQDLLLQDTAAGAVGPVLTFNNMGNAAGDQARINYMSNSSVRAYINFVVRTGGAGYITLGTGPAGAPVVNFTFGENGLLTGTKFINVVSYTPTWTATTTNPTLGNGTLTGYYARMNDLVWYMISLTIGTTTALGTGTWEFAAPVAAANPPRFYAGSVQVLDSGVADYLGISRLDQTSTRIRGIVYNGGAAGAAASLGPAIPHAWGNGDVCVLSGFYRA